MIISAAIIGVSLIVSAAILFAGLTNQHTQVVYVAPSTQELLVELVKRTTKEVEGLTSKVQAVSAKATETGSEVTK